MQQKHTACTISFKSIRSVDPLHVNIRSNLKLERLHKPRVGLISQGCCQKKMKMVHHCKKVGKQGETVYEEQGAYYYLINIP